MELKKATLRPAYQEEGKEIEFMFNPSELKFSRSVNIEQSQGSRSHSGQNKTSFKHPNPYQLTISNLILDTYERKNGDRDVLKELKPFTDAIAYVKDGKGKEKRPPVYLFTWGTNVYLRCFIKTCNFRLTLFLPDGTPVRAILDLTLEQADDKAPKPSQGTPNVSLAQRKSQGRPGSQGEKDPMFQ
jgi:Contractile injection system tube protein